MKPPKNVIPLEILNGWKEIANYIGKGVRTVQRYERELGLPIHRPAEKSSAAVVASKAELREWVLAGPIRVDMKSKRLRGRTNRVGADFLRIDSEVAMTFSGMALQASNPEKRRRATRTARNAYDTIMRLRKNIDLDEAQREELDANLRRLKSELQSLGQRF